MAQLLGILLKGQRRGPISTPHEAQITLHHGVEGDWRGKPGNRQVTLMSLEAWQAVCNELGVELPWEARRANLLVDTLPLYQSTGAHIIIGDVMLEVTGETEPCERMHEVHPDLYYALAKEWRGGVTCRVLSSGTVHVGMHVEMLRRMA